jgi:hypothetical protein
LDGVRQGKELSADSRQSAIHALWDHHIDSRSDAVSQIAKI